MRIGFVGAGKVGSAFGRFLCSHGVELAGYADQRRKAAEAAAASTGTRVYEDAQTLLADCDALFLTVPDGRIRDAYGLLPSDALEGKMLCHCSGSLTTGETFPGLAQAGGFGYSLHPLVAVSARPDAWRVFEGAWFSIEGDAVHLGEWERLLESCGAHVRAIDPASKVRYHAACAISSNLVCALVAESIDLLSGCGFSEDEARSALAPLLRANMENLVAVGPQDALTGPVERCDVVTVQKHLDCLPGEAERELYRAASARLLPLAQARHPESDYTAMARLLGACSPEPNRTS